jgi:translation initiation factor 5B
LEKKLSIHVSGPGKGTVLEVKEERGLGKTVDVVLYDGVLAVGSEIVVGGRSGIIRARVRALLEPKPLNEIRDPKDKFDSVKEVHAAAGVKIAAPGLEDALAGSPLLVVEKGNEEQKVLEEIHALKIESEAVGPIVRTDALGSLEALVKLIESLGLKPRSANVGDISRKDIIEAGAVKEKDRFKGIVFGFNVKILPEAEEEAKKRSVQVFRGNVIYSLIEDYNKWLVQERDAEKRQRLESVVWPFKFKVLPNCVFRNSRPAIVGVRVLAGKIAADVEVMHGGKIVGRIRAIQSSGKSLKEACQNAEVAVSIDDAVVGRNLKAGDDLCSFIPESHFVRLEEIRGELSKEENSLLEEIRKIEAKAKKQA